MDLSTIQHFNRPSDPLAVTDWSASDAWLAGGTWLFSEPQVHLTTLHDIQGFNWPSLTITEAGLEIAATCRIAELDALVDSKSIPQDWTAAPLFRQCARALQASFKICNEATVGGNICLSLPAGSMIAMVAALDATLTLWPREGEPRQLSVMNFVTGIQANVLQPGELLRSIFIPVASLRNVAFLERFTLTSEGRSTALLIGTLCPHSGHFILTLTAATVRPYQWRFDHSPTKEEINASLATVPDSAWFFDPHGTPDFRRHISHYLVGKVMEAAAANNT